MPAPNLIPMRNTPRSFAFVGIPLLSAPPVFLFNFNPLKFETIFHWEWKANINIIFHYEDVKHETKLYKILRAPSRYFPFEAKKIHATASRRRSPISIGTTKIWHSLLRKAISTRRAHVKQVSIVVRVWLFLCQYFCFRNPRKFHIVSKIFDTRYFRRNHFLSISSILSPSLNLSSWIA